MSWSAVFSVTSLLSTHRKISGSIASTSPTSAWTSLGHSLGLWVTRRLARLTGSARCDYKVKDFQVGAPWP
eukprot:6472896-Amphidinium_carterae.2